MTTVSELFSKVGEGFNTIFKSEQALYGLYFIAFFFGIFTLYRVLINRIPHLQGKPANVIAFMVTVISVGGIFFNKSYSELIGLFNGFTGFLLLLFISIGFLMLMFYTAKDKEGTLKYFFLSFGFYVSSSIISEPFKEFWVSSKTSGAAHTISGLVSLISTISGIMVIIFIVLLFFKIFNFDPIGKLENFGKKFEKSPEKKNHEQVKTNLKNIKKETNEAQNTINDLTKILEKIETEVKGKKSKGVGLPLYGGSGK